MNHNDSRSTEQNTAIESTKGWPEELLSAYSSVEDLLFAGLISDAEATQLRSIGERFRVRIPRYYAALFDGTPGCPIRLQAIPSLTEVDPTTQHWPEWAKRWSRLAFNREQPWVNDAIGDISKLAAPRLTHRYGNRAILHVSSSCAMYCRFCFRKTHLNAAERTLYEGSLESAFSYLSSTPEIHELILTGGDPLSMTDRWISNFLDRLDGISHLTHVRIHTKMPCTLPSRITDELASALSNRRFRVALVAHFNHPRELTSSARQSLARLTRAGITLYAQSVLLRGINDDVQTLELLFQTLYENGVTPFYLHHPDHTPGTFQFRLSIERGRQLVRDLSGLLSGPALPHYVLDLPGGDGKVPLLDTQRVQLTRQRIEHGISGSLYQIIPPQTREHFATAGTASVEPTGGLRTEPLYYAEFWPS